MSFDRPPRETAARPTHDIEDGEHVDTDKPAAATIEQGREEEIRRSTEHIPYISSVPIPVGSLKTQRPHRTPRNAIRLFASPSGFLLDTTKCT